MKPVLRTPFCCRTLAAPRSLALLALAGAAALGGAQAQTLAPSVQAVAARAAEVSPVHARWQSTLDAFAQTDRAQHPADDGVLFVGSSTIRLWSSLSQDFRQVPVIINRGFGGSTMRDCNALVRELVLQYKPRQVMVYAGDNDLAEGRAPEDVLASLQQFVRQVRAELPGTRISYISIKPSPERAALLPKVRQANALIAGYVQSVPAMRYIDIFTPMLDAQGQPRAELFGADRLHLNEAGYRLWQSVIAADLSSAPALPPAPAQPPPQSPPQQVLAGHL